MTTTARRRTTTGTKVPQIYKVLQVRRRSGSMLSTLISHRSPSVNLQWGLEEAKQMPPETSYMTANLNRIVQSRQESCKDS